MKTIETVIGNGNRFHDVSFLWSPDAHAFERAGTETAARAMGAAFGFSLVKFISPTVTQGELRIEFEEALTSRPPRPLATDLIRFVLSVSQDIEDFAARRDFVREFTQWISEGRGGALAEWQHREEDAFKVFDDRKLRNHIQESFDGPVIVVERSPPTAEAVMSLLSKGSGVAIGAYMGFHAAADVAPLYLYAAVPGGILLCCTAAGIAEAIQMGLRERIYKWLRAPSREAHPDHQGSVAHDVLDQPHQSVRQQAILPWHHRRGR
jgi:hypothetical protein